MSGRKTGRIWLAVALVLTAATVSAHEGREHGKKHGKAQMTKLHRMMPRYAKAEAKITAALDGGDLKGVVTETDYLNSTLADLKSSKPHKNVAALGEYREIAAGFGKDVKAAADAARKGDSAGAKAAFASAQEKCVSCHAKFRD